MGKTGKKVAQASNRLVCWAADVSPHPAADRGLGSGRVLALLLLASLYYGPVFFKSVSRGSIVCRAAGVADPLLAESIDIEVGASSGRKRAHLWPCADTRVHAFCTALLLQNPLMPTFCAGAFPLASRASAVLVICANTWAVRRPACAPLVYCFCLSFVYHGPGLARTSACRQGAACGQHSVRCTYAVVLPCQKLGV